MTSLLQDSATRNRSNSGEDSGLPEHDRKRPRLSEGKSDAERPLPNIISGQHQSTTSESALTSLGSPQVSPEPALPPRSPEVAMATSPTSKVTINTRPLSSQSMTNNIPVSGDGAVDASENIASTDLSSTTTAPEAASKSAPDHSHETISISSSPVGSPEIEIAEVEDYDQDPSETRWTTRIGGSDAARSIHPSQLRRTFPFASDCKPGEGKQAILRVTKILSDPLRDPGSVFQAVKEWLIGFAASCDSLTEEVTSDDFYFWTKLYLIPEALLKRDQQQTTPTVGCQDLIDFFVAYGQLTKFIFHLETRKCVSFTAGNLSIEDFEKILAASSWNYLTSITWLLTQKCTLLSSLQKYHGLDAMLIIRPCCQRLMGPNGLNLMESIADLISALGDALIKSPRSFKDFSVVSTPLERLLDLVLTTPESTNIVDVDTSHAIDTIKDQLQNVLYVINNLLQVAIRKQCAWLTMDYGGDIINRVSPIVSRLGAYVPRFGLNVIAAAGVVVNDGDHENMEIIVAYAWRFMMYHKFLRHGRMELRVCGVDRMCGELLTVFYTLIRDKIDGLQQPLVKFLARFLRENDIIQYVISVASHPQILQRSANLIGFLSVSRTYTSSDTDHIWDALIEGQDPRTVHEIISLLQRCFDTFEVDDTIHVCHKLVELPAHRFDSRMLEFALAALAALRIKTPRSLSQYFSTPMTYDPVSRKLCLRLLRIVSSPSVQFECWSTYQKELGELLSDFLHASKDPGRCLAVSEQEEQDILSELKEDMESHSEASAGAIYIAQRVLTLRALSAEAKVSLIDRSGLPQALVEELAICKARSACLTQIEASLNCLSLLFINVPDKFDDEQLSIVWTSLLSGRTILPEIRMRTWTQLTVLMRSCKQPNSAIDRLLKVFWPKLQLPDFSKAVLEFAEQSIAYEAEISEQTIPQADGVVTIPGIERVWTIMLDAPGGTLETEATDFVINQYLRNQMIKRAPKTSVRATHLGLIDRCVNLVLSSAARLKSFAESEAHSDGDDEMVILATPDEIRIEESRFDRSLLFLRRFTEAIKGNPGCSPIASRQLDGLPEFPNKRGESIDLKVQVYGNRYVNDAQRSVSVGASNTGSELWAYLSSISGFSSFTVLNNGKARNGLENETSTLEELRIVRGALMVNKTPETVEQIPLTRLRVCSPVDEKIVLHFDELYGLLESDNRLAKEVYDFLNITTVREKVSQLARSMQTPADDLLPIDKPYKLLFCTQALRSPVELDSFSNTPDAQFLSYAVGALATALSKLALARFDGALQKLVAYELIDTLQIAFRAKVPIEVSKVYLGRHEHFATKILQYLDAVLGADAIEMQQLQAEKMTHVAFEVLLEARLQDEALWKCVDTEAKLADVLGRAILSDGREKVRQSMLDVLLGLTGSSTPKFYLKTLDPRAARARYDSSTIEACLTRVWELLLEILPNTTDHKQQCQEFFDSLLAILRRIGKTFETTPLQSLFKQWSGALLQHDSHEIVGQPMRDRFIPGITKIIFECARLLRLKHALNPQSKLMRQIITRFLFPPLSQIDLEEPSQIPILDPDVRENLYELLILMCDTPTEVNIMASELSDDLVSAEQFEPNISNERLALRTEVGYAGLRNLSNTCYLNSLFSQLFMNVQFRELLLTTPVVDQRQQKLIWEVAKVFAHMQGSYDKSIEPTAAVDSIVTYDGENIDVTVQMDVDEFFNLLFDRLESQILDHGAKSRFKSLYGGQTIQQIKSKECEHVSERPEAFAVLPVEIKEKYRLEDSLKAFVEGELLQGDNKYSCTSCGRLVDAVKRSCLKEVPDNLIFNLKRFDYDIMTGLRCKLNEHFQFPDVLDVAPYTLEHLSQPDRPLTADNFELTGVIVHSGTADSGHYFSYIRQRPSARDKHHSWVQFNDADVTNFDPGHIQDNCFGGPDANWNNLPKFYNAYMLFYQRTSSIQSTEQYHKHTDTLNPIRLSVPPQVQEHIEKENELFLRAYCAQDPAHARFVRQLLDRLWDTGQGQCTDDHDVETRCLHLALNYMHSISSRWKTQPEMEATSKMVNKYSRRCTTCAAVVLRFFTGEHVLSESIVKSPFQATRKTFSYMLRCCLDSLRATLSEEPSVDLAQLYQDSLYKIVENLGKSWELVSRTARAWAEYFHLVAEIVDLGVDEARMVIENLFFQFVLELIQVHFYDNHDLRPDRKLRARYTAYLTARERNRPFNHNVLIYCFARMLYRLDLNTWPTGDQRTLKPGSEQMGATYAEIEMLGLHVSPHNFDWLKRIIAGRHAGAVADQMVVHLAGERQLAGAVSQVIGGGLEHKNMATASAFLGPLLAFCASCGNLNQIVDLVTRFAESVSTIGLEFGKDYCITINLLLHRDNQTLGREAGFLQDVLVEQMHQWAPVLLVAGGDGGGEVRTDALELVSVLLLDRLDATRDEEPAEYRAYQSRALPLAKAAAEYIQTAFLSSNASDSNMLQHGHAQQVTQAVERCLASAEMDNVEDEQQVEEIQRVIAELKGRADQAVETMSADWQESSEMDPMSDEFESLVSP